MKKKVEKIGGDGVELETGYEGGAGKGFNNLIKELLVEDTRGYQNMMRMSHETFLEILRSIEKDITPNNIIGGGGTINADNLFFCKRRNV